MTANRIALLVALVLLAPAVGGLRHNALASPAPDTTELVSVAIDESAGNGPSGPDPGEAAPGRTRISANQRFVVFASTAFNLVSGDNNGRQDVFVRDRQTGTTTLVSRNSDGTLGNDRSYDPVISADGLYVAFASQTTNLVPGDTNGFGDIFLHNRQTGVTTRVNVASDGTQASGGVSHQAAISADGRFVAFYSNAPNLVPGDTNADWDVFVRDTLAGTTERVSVSTSGAQGNSSSVDPTLSADGRYVAFESGSNTFVSGDNNGGSDIFVRDRDGGTTTLVSIRDGGGFPNSFSIFPVISADGRYVAYHGPSTDVIPPDANGPTHDIIERDRQSGTNRRVNVATDGTQANLQSRQAAVSRDGRYVAYTSGANNLVSGDTNEVEDIFLHDTQTGATTRVSIPAVGGEGNGASTTSSISEDGRLVCFASLAGNLVAGDTNGNQDVFLHGPPFPSCSGVALCSGHGTCAAPDACSCDAGWTGADCSVPASGAAGRVPGDAGSPGVPLIVARAAGEITLAWGASCTPTDTDYSVFEGTIGAFYSHTARLCTTGGSLSSTFTPGAGDRYYLVVPSNGSVEGSYGRDSAGGERPVGASVCLPQAIAACP